MSTTIDSLDIQITTSAGQAENKINQLATALGRLKENAGLTKVTNNLNKLAGSLNTLNAATNSNSFASLNRLATAMNGLSSIQKLTGLNSALNTLKKLPDIIDKLDVANLDKFADQMERLANALAPVARQITAVANGFSRLPRQISSAVTATNRMADATDRLDSGGLNLMAGFANIESFLNIANQIINVMSGVIAEAMEWDGIQYRFGRAFGEDAEEVYAYVQKLNDVMGINVQQFMQYSSLYGSLLKGFGLAQEKVTTMSVGLTELSYDIWAAYNDRFKSLEEASEAVRSAITGEIEPIRNAGIALTEASLQEYLEQIGMAEVSIEKLSEAQKAEVRYAAMMNAAMQQGIVGTYAAEMHTAEGAVRNLTQTLKTLVQAFGSLFIPVLQLVVPYLSAFVELLVEAVHWVAALFGIELFAIDWSSASAGAGGVATGMEDIAAGATDATSGLDDAAKAAKKLKDYTLGFDELNVISPPSESSGSGSGGAGGGAGGVGDSGWGDGLDLDTLWDDSVFAKASQQVDALKQKLKDWFEEWKTELAIIGAALGVLGLTKLLSHLGQALGLGEKFLGVMNTIGKLATSAIIITLQYTLMTEFFDKFIDGEGFKNYIAALFVGALGTLALYSMWGPAGLVIGLSVIAAASLSAIIENGGITNMESAIVALTGLASAAGAVAAAFKMLKGTNVGAFFALLKEGNPLLGTLAATFPKIANVVSKVGTAFRVVSTVVGGFLSGISAPVWAGIVAAIAAVVSVVVFLKENWEEVTAAVKKFFDEKIEPKLDSIKQSWEKMKKAVSDAGKAIKDALPDWMIDWIDDIKSNFSKFVDEWREKWQAFCDLPWLDTLMAILEKLGEWVFVVLGTAVAGTINTVVGLIENAVQAFSGAVQIIAGVIEVIVSLFSGDLDGARVACEKIIDGIVDLFSGLWGLVFQPVKDFFDGVIGFFTNLYDELVGHSIVPDMIDAIVEWFTSLPGKIFKSVEDFVKGIIKKFKDMWTSIKSWYTSTVAPKLTTAYWKGVFDKVVKGVSDKLTELKNKINTKWGEVKTWFKSNVAPKLTVDYWKTKFDTIRSALKTKLDEAWEKVKDFFDVTEWKKKVTDAMDTIKKNFKIPDLPKIKLSVSWDTNVGKVKTAVYEALGLSGWPKLSWSTYAQGGFPTTGQMFIANEAGPELIGNIGNRTAVANNDQIVAAVSQGVYNAVRAAMNGGNSGQNINVYLDGKQLYTSFKKTEAERGANIMGNQLGYSY